LEAFGMNGGGGWTEQKKNIENYLPQAVPD